MLLRFVAWDYSGAPGLAFTRVVSKALLNFVTQRHRKFSSLTLTRHFNGRISARRPRSKLSYTIHPPLAQEIRSGLSEWAGLEDICHILILLTSL